MNIKHILLTTLCLFTFVGSCFAQNNQNQSINTRSDFWEKVRFGGGLGLSFGNNNTQITVAPFALYEINQYVALGPGLNYTYQKFGDFKSTLYGVSAIVLANPIQELQLSAELEQLRVNQSQRGFEDNDFWNTALFMGAGYRLGGVVAGIRYNVLFQDGESIYAEAWQPFVRVYF